MNFLIFAVFLPYFCRICRNYRIFGVCCVRGFWRQIPVYTLLWRVVTSSCPDQNPNIRVLHTALETELLQPQNFLALLRPDEGIFEKTKAFFFSFSLFRIFFSL